MNNIFGGQNPLALLGQLRQNPIGMLAQAGFNVPAGTNDPQAIIQHLLNSQQLTQTQLNQARQMAQKLGL